MPDQCPVCGLAYHDFRTGLTFKDVREMLWTPGPPPWRQKRRRSVLGFWHQIKQIQWSQHIDECEYGTALNEVPF